jgi:hypothetical protein
MARMVYHNPPTAVLGHAEVIMFFDMNVRDWKEVVVGRKAGQIGAGDLDTIQIPVDSTDANVLQNWRDRIALARA